MGKHLLKILGFLVVCFSLTGCTNMWLDQNLSPFSPKKLAINSIFSNTYMYEARATFKSHSPLSSHGGNTLHSRSIDEHPNDPAS